MSWRDTPLYIEAHALALDVLPRLGRWRDGGHPELAAAVGTAALTLVAEVGRALTFPEGRGDALRAADRAVLDLRLYCRIALDLGLLYSGAHRALADRGLRCGRMIGGWQRRVIGEARAPPP